MTPSTLPSVTKSPTESTAELLGLGGEDGKTSFNQSDILPLKQTPAPIAELAAPVLFATSCGLTAGFCPARILAQTYRTRVV
ncbi:MAG: hypothetical protein KDA96_14220, partial [Planctomycetaceae bacterium]|nr:hypothetical protein [Planctomycetaceae bacterium]